MDKAEAVFNKLSFVTPMKIKSKKELASPKGYVKERVNMMTGGIMGALPGAAAAVVAHTKKRLPMRAAGGALAVLGGTVGAISSLRKGEKSVGVKPTGVGKYIGRATGATVGDMVLPGIGGPLADYAVSRKLYKYKDAK